MRITICIGSSCHLKGSREIIQTLEKLALLHNIKENIEISGSFCMDECTRGVCVKIDDELFSVLPDTAEKFFRNEVLKRIV